MGIPPVKSSGNYWLAFKLILLVLVFQLVLWLFWMPGTKKSTDGIACRSVSLPQQERLRHQVMALAREIGPRNFCHYEQLGRAGSYLIREFRKLGLTAEIQSYRIRQGFFGREWREISYGKQNYRNLIVEIKGSIKPEEIVVVGAHYDSVAMDRCRGANDNASGVAVLLELARYFSAHPGVKTLRLVAFVNEEPPFFWTAAMGSYVYAAGCLQRRDNIVAMLALDSVGYYSDVPGSQNYPVPLLRQFYPERGNFIGIIGNVASSGLVRDTVAAFRGASDLPAYGASMPQGLPGIGDSDHWSFWQMNYPGVMVTDTAHCRDPGYHSTHDDPERLDYRRIGQVAQGMQTAVKRLIR